MTSQIRAERACVAARAARLFVAFAAAFATCVWGSSARAQQQPPQFVAGGPEQGVQPQPLRPRRVMRPICSVRAAGQATAFGFALGIPVFAGGAEVGVNCPRLNFGSVHFAPGLAFGYLNGSSEHGLDFESFAFGPEVELAPASLDLLKFALGFGVEIPFFNRITTGDSLVFAGFQTNGRVSIDLIRQGRFAVWLGAGARLAAFYNFTEVSFTPSAQLGLRI